MVAHLQPPHKSSRPHAFVYRFVFALLASAAMLTTGAESQEQPTPSGSAENEITVWKVGSPFGGDTPHFACQHLDPPASGRTRDAIRPKPGGEAVR